MDKVWGVLKRKLKLLLGKDRRILILAPDTSKAPTMVFPMKINHFNPKFHPLNEILPFNGNDWVGTLSDELNPESIKCLILPLCIGQSQKVIFSKFSIFYRSQTLYNFFNLTQKF